MFFSHMEKAGCGRKIYEIWNKIPCMCASFVLRLSSCQLRLRFSQWLHSQRAVPKSCTWHGRGVLDRHGDRRGAGIPFWPSEVSKEKERKIQRNEWKMTLLVLEKHESQKPNLIIILLLRAFRLFVLCVCFAEPSPTTISTPVTLIADLHLLETLPLPLGHALLQVEGCMLDSHTDSLHISLLNIYSNMLCFTSVSMSTSHPYVTDITSAGYLMTWLYLMSPTVSSQEEYKSKLKIMMRLELILIFGLC